MSETFLCQVCPCAYASSVSYSGVLQQVHGVGEESNRAVHPVPEEVPDGRMHGDKFCGQHGTESLPEPEDTQLLTKLRSNMKGALMTVADKILVRKRAIIESVNDELKNMAQIEHSRHRSVANFTVNLIAGLSAYCFFPQKPMIALDRCNTIDTYNQLTLF